MDDGVLIGFIFAALDRKFAKYLDNDLMVIAMGMTPRCIVLTQKPINHYLACNLINLVGRCHAASRIQFIVW
jgi:hypothetical protein